MPSSSSPTTPAIFVRKSSLKNAQANTGSESPVSPRYDAILPDANGVDVGKSKRLNFVGVHDVQTSEAIVKNFLERLALLQDEEIYPSVGFSTSAQNR